MSQIQIMMSALCRSIAPLALGLLLTGCITTAEKTAERNSQRCIERGYQPKTDAFDDCVVRLETERGERMETRRREMMEAPISPPISRGH